MKFTFFSLTNDGQPVVKTCILGYFFLYFVFVCVCLLQPKLRWFNQQQALLASVGKLRSSQPLWWPLCRLHSPFFLPASFSTHGEPAPRQKDALVLLLCPPSNSPPRSLLFYFKPVEERERQKGTRTAVLRRDRQIVCALPVSFAPLCLLYLPIIKSGSSPALPIPCYT